MSDLLPQKNPRVEISSHALNDLEEIWLYVSAHSEQRADLMLRQLTKKFSVLLKSPKIGKERSDLLVGLRSFPTGNHIIFYQETVFGIEIVRVIHGSRDVQQIFDEMIPLEP